MDQPLMAEKNLAVRGPSKFTFLWLGSSASSIGDCLTRFALNIWILQATESVSSYTLSLLFITLPAFILAPLSGTLVDRWPRRWTMVIAELGSALCILTLALLFVIDSIQIWHIYLLTSISAICMEFESLAFKATISLLVPTENLARATGLTRITDAIAGLGAPLLAGILLSFVQIQGILLVDCFSFFIGIIPLLIFRIPEVNISTPEQDLGEDSKGGQDDSLVAEIMLGWNYVTDQKGLPSLMILRSVYTFMSTAGRILFIPMILTLTTTDTVGLIVCIAGLGGVIGGIIMGTWVNRQEFLIPIICGCIFVSGLEAIVSGLRPSLILMTVGSFSFLLTLSLIDGSIQVVLQKYVLPELQGRIFSLSNAIMAIASLMAIASGSVVDKILEPLMFFEGAWASTIGQVIGTGPGRGIGLMYILLGGMAIVTAAVASQHTPLLQLEGNKK